NSKSLTLSRCLGHHCSGGQVRLELRFLESYKESKNTNNTKTPLIPTKSTTKKNTKILITRRRNDPRATD
ncbi:hypothetical protein LINPERHAP1_LOCUS26295, partial [Linum perenne]